jgi:L-methionine (R)-S-oxide reductase
VADAETLPTELPADAAEAYRLIEAQARALVRGESDAVANAANVAALLGRLMRDVNWVGFYFVRGQELVLGPFAGLPACVRIGRGRGVCGTAWAEDRTQVVPDVHAFPGHIACDSASRSEVVVPLRADGKVVGVLDCDSPSPGRFGPREVGLLETVAGLVADACRWPAP